MTMTRQFKSSQLKTPYLIITGSVFAQVNTKNDIFLIQSASRDMLKITQSGVVILSTQSIELTGSAPVGGIYFTSGSFFVGLEM